MRAFAFAKNLADKDIACNEAIGEHGLDLIRALARKARRQAVAHPHPLQRRLAGDRRLGHGDRADLQGAGRRHPDLHVFVDETRPRNQGASLTAFELGQQNVPHTLIVDNAGGHLMQHGEIDLVIVGADRIAANGDACNKIGTYLKALAAKDCGVPFYVAAPVSTFDSSLAEGRLIPDRGAHAEEVTHIAGMAPNGEVVSVRIAPKDTPARNPGFDVTPARLVSGIITEKGVYDATTEDLAALISPAR